MSATHVTYKEEDVHALSTLTWDNVATILQAAHNVRFCGSETNAINEITGGGQGDSVVIAAAFPFVIGEFTLKFKLSDPDKAAFERVMPMPGCHYTTYNSLDKYMTSTTPENWTSFAGSLAKTTSALTADQHQMITTSLAKHLLEFFDNALASNKNQNAMVLIKPILTDAMYRTDQNDRAYGRLGKVGSKHTEASWYSKQVFLVNGHGMDKSIRERQTERCLGALVQMAGYIVGHH